MKKFWLLLFALLTPAACNPAPAMELSFDVKKCYYESMRILGINAPPALGMITEDHSYKELKGLYYPSTILLRKDADCGVLAHEMYHHKLFGDLGQHKTWEEYKLRELQAQAFELWWRKAAR